MSKYKAGDEIAPEDIKPGMTIRTTEYHPAEGARHPFKHVYGGTVKRVDRHLVHFEGSSPGAYRHPDNSRGVAVTHTFLGETKHRVGWYWAGDDGDLARWWDGEIWRLAPDDTRTGVGGDFSRPLLDPAVEEDLAEMARIVKEKTL